MTVGDILNGQGDQRVLKMIQRAIDKVNTNASCKQHKVSDGDVARVCMWVWLG